MSKELQCWSCKAVFTLSEHADCDGCCWKCGVEIDLNEMDIPATPQPPALGGEPEGFITHGPDPVTGNELVHRWTHIEQAERHIRGIDGLNGWKITRLYRHAQPATAKVDENAEFEAWWQRTEILQKNKATIAREAWQARAKLNTPQ